MYWWGKPQFSGIRAAASGLSDGAPGGYDIECFREDFPQFFRADGSGLLPDPMLQQIIDMANASVRPDRWGSSWRYAAGLYAAHYVTLSLRGYAPSNETPEQAAASGALSGVVKSATLGDASVTYDTGAITAGTEDWGDLNRTTYGQMFASRAKLVGMGGMTAI